MKFLDHDETLLKEETVGYNKSATAPDTPTREGYTFIGWDKPFENITENLIIKAQYEIKSYTVKFIDFDGTVLKEVKVKHGKGATAPNDPIRQGYEFSGWDKSFAEVTSDLDINAVYTINKYTITFDSDGGSFISPIEVDYKDTISEPVTTRDGYKFEGWFEGNTKFNFNTEITDNISLTARWSIITYSITYNLNGGRWTWGSTSTNNTNKYGIAGYSPIADEFMKDFYIYLKDNNLLSDSIIHPSLRDPEWNTFSNLGGDPMAYYNRTGEGSVSGDNDGFSQFFFTRAEGNSTTGLFTKIEGGFFGTEPYKGKYWNLAQQLSQIAHVHYNKDYQTTRFWDSGSDSKNHTGKSLMGFVLDGFFYGTQGLGSDNFNTLRRYAPRTTFYRYIKNGSVIKEDTPYQKDEYQIGTTYILPMPVGGKDHFLGWYTTPNFRANSKVTSINPEDFGDITLYARWGQIGSNMNMGVRKDLVDTRLTDSDGNDLGSTTIKMGTKGIVIRSRWKKLGYTRNVAANQCQYRSSDELVITIDDKGVLTTKGKGTVTLTVYFGFRYEQIVVTVN